MRVGVLTRSTEHVSLELLRQELVHNLGTLGVDLRPFPETGPLPPCDVVWDPALGMSEIPPILWTARQPVVVDVLGLRTFSVAIEDLYADPAQREAEVTLRERVRAGWSDWCARVAAVVVCSDFLAAETVRALGVPPERIHRSYLGVDREIFHAGDEVPSEEPYFLYVSSGDPGRKNTARVLAAYASLPADRRPPLVLKALGHRGGVDVPGVRVVSDFEDVHALVRWYRGALALVFPSLYEGFGLPIVEAMACGCPVITARKTACGEVGGDAALLVDPWSEKDIAGALRRMMDDPALRVRSRAAGLARAATFEWRRAAREHLDVFRQVTRRSFARRVGRLFAFGGRD